MLTGKKFMHAAYLIEELGAEWTIVRPKVVRTSGRAGGSQSVLSVQSEVVRML